MIHIRDISEIQSGAYLKPAPDPNAYYLLVNDFDNEGNILHTTKPSVVADGKAHNHFLREGDLLFAAKGNKNFCTIIQKEYEAKSIASSSFLVLRIKDKSIVFPEFLCWYLNLSATLQKLSDFAVGTSMPSITKAMLEGVEINLPALDIQKKIVDVAELQKKERLLYEGITFRRKQIIDYKLKNIITNGE